MFSSPMMHREGAVVEKKLPEELHEKLRSSLLLGLQDGRLGAALEGWANSSEEEQKSHLRQKLRKSLSLALEDGRLGMAVEEQALKKFTRDLINKQLRIIYPKAVAASLNSSSRSEEEKNSAGEQFLEDCAKPKSRQTSSNCPSTVGTGPDLALGDSEESECSAEEIEAALDTLDAAAAAGLEEEKEEEPSKKAPSEEEELKSRGSEIEKEPPLPVLAKQQPAEPKPSHDGWLRRLLRRTCGTLSGRSHVEEE